MTVQSAIQGVRKKKRFPAHVPPSLPVFKVAGYNLQDWLVGEVVYIAVIITILISQSTKMPPEMDITLECLLRGNCFY